MKKIEKYSVVSDPETITRPIRILLVDDQSFVRRFIHKSLRSRSKLKHRWYGSKRS